MVRPFQNAQILAFWFSESKLMTVWRYFFGEFSTKNRVNFCFRCIHKICRKTNYFFRWPSNYSRSSDTNVQQLTPTSPQFKHFAKWPTQLVADKSHNKSIFNVPLLEWVWCGWVVLVHGPLSYVQMRST
jgi:hypothetical protein